MAEEGFAQTADGIEVRSGRGHLRIDICSDAIARIRYRETPEMISRPSLVTIEPAGPAGGFSVDTGSELRITTSAMSIEVSRETGQISFRDVNGSVLLRTSSHALVPATVVGESVFNAEQKFKVNSGEALYGLGQFQNGVMNWRGRQARLVQENIQAVIPFVVSTGNWGVLWHNASDTWFSDDESGMRFWSEVADNVDYYFMCGSSIDDVIARYREITGAAPMFGKWAYGYWQCKERYKTQEEVLATAREHRERGIPIDNLVQDWQYWGDNSLWNSTEFKKEIFPDPKAMMRELHDRHFHLMISVWPTFGNDTRIRADMDSRGHLFHISESWNDVNVIYNSFDPRARDLYWKYVNRGIFSKGVDAWWMDATEPECGKPELKTFQTGIGSFARHLNAYSLATCLGFYENQRRVTEAKRVFILTRSAFAGQQRYAAATWSGDISATWNVFRRQISAGVNFCMAGIPYWTTDIGAFLTAGAFIPGAEQGVFPRGVASQEYRELYVRWFQFGAFCPLFRSHGTQTPREMWNFGDPGTPHYDALLKFDRLRYRLIPYIYSLAWKVTDEGYTIMRGLAMDFPRDRHAQGVDDEFMFGPALLAAPVTRNMYAPPDGEHEVVVEEGTPPPAPGVRNVYLPGNTQWTDFWTGRSLSGGRDVPAQAPLDIMPLYVRAGSILPMGPHIQYTDEKPADPLEIRIYPGDDGSFTLYEDQGDGYDYENGAYSTIAFDWNDASRTLSIGERNGSFPGMLRERTFNIVLVSPAHGEGIEITGNSDKTVRYEGEAVRAEL